MTTTAQAVVDGWIDGVPRIPLGDWIESGFDWLTDTFGEFLNTLGDLVESALDGIIGLLTGPAPLVVAAVFALLAWLARNWKLGAGTFVGMAFIISMDQWDNAMATLALVVFATVLALVVAIPLGIMAARWDPVRHAVRPVLDLMQTMPAFVWLVPVVTLFGLNVTAGLAATVIFALPPGVRLTELGIRQVDPEVVEAGHAFGATPTQILREVQLPLAMPTVMAGVNQVIMLALSMAVIAGLVGAGGLGGAVTTSISRLEVGLGFEAGLSVVVLAIFLDRVTAAAGEAKPGQGRLRRLLARFTQRRVPASEATDTTAQEPEGAHAA